MSTSLVSDGLILPEEILSEILLMVGLESLESLHRCRQVCQTWNELIMKDIWENPRKKNIALHCKIATKIKRKFLMFPSNDVILHAKWQGKHKILISLNLVQIDYLFVEFFKFNEGISMNKISYI